MKKDKTKKRVYEKILSAFAWLTFILAVLLSVITVCSTFSDEKNGKQIFGHKMLIVASDSMSKSAISEDEKIFFNVGDLIIVRTTDDFTKLEVGQVISFFSYNPDSYGKTLTHKIRSIKYSSMGKLIGYETYGINTGVSDQAVVQPESIIGVYAFKIPTVGNVFSFLKTPRGFYLSILTPSILLIIFFSIKVGKYFGKREAIKEYPYNQEIEELKQRIAKLEQREESLATVDSNNEVIEPKSPSIQGKSRSFTEKLLSLDDNVKGYFNTMHNTLVSYKKVRARVSFKCISYRFGRDLLAKITVRGKTLKLHLALKLDEFNEKVFFQQDYSNIKAYEDVPFTVKVKSERGEKNAVKLIEALMQTKGIAKNDKYEQVDFVSLLVNDLQSNETESAISSDVISLSITKKSFVEKLLGLEQNTKDYFVTVHNELCSYKKVHERVSFKCVSYRLGRKLLAKVTVRGKTMKLHLALDLQAFNKNVFFQQDYSNIKAYEDVPFTVKVKSNRGEKNAVKLIDALMQANGVVKNDKYEQVTKKEILKIFKEKI
jgi:signal peptidase I